jgi:hypothetical protein
MESVKYPQKYPLSEFTGDIWLLRRGVMEHSVERLATPLAPERVHFPMVVPCSV